MIEPLEVLDELTLEFLESVNYPKCHLAWREWVEKAKDYGLNEQEITELQQFLEENNQLTSPIRFGGRQYWLTKKEMQHLELIRKYFASDWEDEARKRMQEHSLGILEKDWSLQKKMKVN